MQRALIAFGIVLVLLGLLWGWLGRWLFHLPGDIVIERPGLKVFLPFTTMLLVSLVLSLIAWLLRR